MRTHLQALICAVLLPAFSRAQNNGAGCVGPADTLLRSAPDRATLDKPASDYRNALWHDLRAGEDLSGRNLNTRVCLVRKKGPEPRQVLSYRETTLIRFWSRQYDTLLAEPMRGHDPHMSPYAMRPKCHRGCFNWDWTDSLTMHLDTFIYEHRHIVQQDISDSPLPEPDKDFLELYLRSVLVYYDLESFSTDTLLLETDSFLKEHPHAPQAAYVRRVLDQHYKPWGTGVGFYAFAGPSFFRGDLSTYFNDPLYIGWELSFFWRRASITGGYGAAPNRPIKGAFFYNDFDYTTEMRTISPFGHALLGYAVWDNARWRLTPFVGFGGIGFSVEGAEDNVVYYGRQAGLDIDWKFSHDVNVSTYGDAFSGKLRQAYWAVRLRLGYEHLRNEVDDASYGGSQVFVRLGISYFENNARRVKTWKHLRE